jgi:hypothetical protein
MRRSPMTVTRLSAEQRRALQLLASSRHGGSEELLGLGHGCSRQRLAGIGSCGLASGRANGGRCCRSCETG